MQRFVIAVVVGCLFVGGSMSADAKVEVKAIDLGDYKGQMPKGRWCEPRTITSQDELAKAILDKELQAKIAKDVNFDTQKLLYIAWSGLSDDKVTYKVDGDTVTFKYGSGTTKNVRQHYLLFAVPKKCKVENVFPPRWCPGVIYISRGHGGTMDTGWNRVVSRAGPCPRHSAGAVLC